MRTSIDSFRVAYRLMVTSITTTPRNSHKTTRTVGLCLSFSISTDMPPLIVLYLFFLFAGVLSWMWGTIIKNLGSSSQKVPVVLFTTMRCQWCMLVRAFLFLSKRKKI
ncbi:T. brucei spp.-specific protein [Trypanosoma brucei gambiense DAL972]|uniref:T. brucei spp.-specific protein n=1 Tax=Trypanosoma brucei gambiense (strain MHOM/CI/86/DAL972) TaxID=679716 RepID=C9ZLP1_TRYB9|nr:T. brucei spp.-specific protein [Trypanosoma brucei gambiense DAL972]CBH10316.1 T. brucei spp.-specific protein [Trypanosoma brucei gambiense DAL972]|eukprot:XP_011772606.1 T. brucei spp.-specific protein [Trypanosoma brucei gambiense DAL972]